MKNRVNRLFLLLSVLAVVTLSSCNRGYGCPNTFSIGDGFQDLVNSLLQVF